MPAARVCPQPGCPHLQPCPTHKDTGSRGGSTRTWRKTRAHILRRDNGICWICGTPGADSVDHKIPRAHGGSEDPTNLAAAHLACNLRKGSTLGGGAPPGPSPADTAQ